jgi:hypothetical protein
MVPDGEVPGPDPHHVVEAELHDESPFRVHLDTHNRDKIKVNGTKRKM